MHPPTRPFFHFAVPAALLLAVLGYAFAWALERPLLPLVLEHRDGEVRVVRVEPASTLAAAGLRAGDVVLGIGRVGARASGDLEVERFLLEVYNAHRAGESVAVRVRRDAHSLTLYAELRGAPRVYLFSHVVLHGAFWAVVFFLLWVRGEHRGVRALALAVLSMTTGQFLRLAGGIAVTDPVGFAVEQLGVLAKFLGPALVVHFAVDFPAPTRSRRARRRILALAYGVPFLLFCVEEWTLLRGLDPAVGYLITPAWLEALRYWDVRYWVAVGSILGAGLLLLHGYRRLDDEAERRRVKWVMWSVLLAAALDALLMAWTLYGVGHYAEHALLPIRYAVYLLIPAGLLIAVFRDDLFDVDHVIRRTVVNYTTMSVLFILFAGGENLSSEMVGRTLPVRVGEASGWLYGVLGAALFVPVRRWVEHALARLIPGETMGLAQTTGATGSHRG